MMLVDDMMTSILSHIKHCRLLGTILAIGNFINGAGSRGNALGLCLWL